MLIVALCVYVCLLLVAVVYILCYVYELVVDVVVFFFLMIRRPPRSTQSRSSAASDVYKRQDFSRYITELMKKFPPIWREFVFNNDA